MSGANRFQFQGHIAQVLYATAALSPAAVGAGATGTSTITVPGAQIGMEVSVVAQAALGNLGLTAEVSAANTVTLKFHNVTAGSLTPPSTNYTAVVYQYDPVMFT